MIPDNVTIPSIIVVNQDNSEEEGTHWVVLHFKPNNRVEQFDSLGRKPLRYSHNLLISKK